MAVTFARPFVIISFWTICSSMCVSPFECTHPILLNPVVKLRYHHCVLVRMASPPLSLPNGRRRSY